jgi:hypothetical protein
LTAPGLFAAIFQVIPDSMFCMLVLMAVLTTFMMTPLLLRLMRGTELEEAGRLSGWVREEPGKVEISATIRRESY